MQYFGSQEQSTLKTLANATKPKVVCAPAEAVVYCNNKADEEISIDVRPNRSTKPPPKSCLNKLKGSTLLKTEQKDYLDIPEGLLVDCAKDWPNIKKIIDSYLDDTTDIKEDTPEAFFNLLMLLLEKIKNETINNNVLLSDYCKRFIIFFQHDLTKKKLKQYYSYNLTNYRVNMSQRALTLQSRNTALVATREEGLHLENEITNRIENRGLLWNLHTHNSEIKKKCFNSYYQ